VAPTSGRVAARSTFADARKAEWQRRLFESIRESTRRHRCVIDPEHRGLHRIAPAALGSIRRDGVKTPPASTLVMPGAQDAAIARRTNAAVATTAAQYEPVALMRRVSLAGEGAVELRAEVFNVASTPQLLAPNTAVGSAAFGTITAAGGPRVIQLAAKLHF
jgi:hypothetical protein